MRPVLPIILSHTVVVMKEKHTFEQFRAFWTLYELPNYGDIESCKNLRQSFKYCSKEDHFCEFSAVDADYLHMHTISYLCSLSNTSFPYCGIQGSVRRQFAERFQEWKLNQRRKDQKSSNEENTLRGWQKSI